MKEALRLISVFAVIASIFSCSAMFALSPKVLNFGYNGIISANHSDGAVPFGFTDVSADASLQAIMETRKQGWNRRGDEQDGYYPVGNLVGIYEVWFEDETGNRLTQGSNGSRIRFQSSAIEKGDVVLAVGVQNENSKLLYRGIVGDGYADFWINFPEPNTYLGIFVAKDGVLDEASRPEGDTTMVGVFANHDGYTFTRDSDGNITCQNDATGTAVIDEFRCDGTYTYYFQADGTAMKNRLTYHPDGEHVIYFNEYGHEAFDTFGYVKQNISGDAVDDMCYFDTFGYMYVDF